jgi:DNA-binding LytR/AlgR family response regulator
MINNLTVIIAEDDPITRHVIKNLVAEAGMTVVESVSSGTRLVEAYVLHRPDLIIVDIHLERMDGITACRRLFELEYRPKIVIVSGSNDPAHLKAGFELGVIHYIGKPVEPSKFHVAMERAQQACGDPYNALTNHPAQLIGYKYNHKRRYLNQNDILYIEKVGDKVSRLALRNGELIKTSTSLKEFSVQFNTHILSPHRGFLVNIRYIQSIRPDLLVEGNYEIALYHCKALIPLSRRNYHKFSCIAAHALTVKNQYT